MNVEELRDFCISLPDVTEGTPFERFSRGRFTILVFYVCGRMFCYFNIDDFEWVTIKCSADQIADLKERYQAVSEPYNGDKRYWISVAVGRDVSDQLLKTLIKQSYEIVKAKKR